MKLTLKEKKHLIEQIKKNVGESPLFYLKFCSCKKFATDVCNGNLYANTAEYYRRKEIETGERGQGDKFELLSSVKTENIKVFDNETGDLIFTAPTGFLNTKFENDNLIPLVSFVGIPLEDMELIDAKETNADFKFPFTDNEYKKIEESFGEYCVLIGGRELERRISEYSFAIGCDYIFDKIEYCSQNRMDRIEAFDTSSKNRFLYKNSDLEYQREYRLAIGIEIPEDHYIRLNKLNNTKIVKTSTLKKLFFSISYALESK
jgi:hypothetical protein